jgi:hypothetical protein
MKALPKTLLALTAVAALSVVYPASVQAVPTTYVYTGNPFTDVTGPYTTSDFVSGILTLAGPLAPNFSGNVSPTAFTFSDGVQTISTFRNPNASFIFGFVTGPTSQITQWGAGLSFNDAIIETSSIVEVRGRVDRGDILGIGHGIVFNNPGIWSTAAVPDGGTSLASLSLSLTALGVAARHFKRAAA